MIARRLALALSLFAAGSVSAAPPIYMQLDGRWYTIGDGPRIWWYDGYGFYMPTSTATGCVRANGGSQTFGGIGLYLGQFFYPVYRIKAFSYRSIPQLPGYFGMYYTSEPGDMVCDNEIPSPIPDKIFANGFERTGPLVIPGDTIFIGWFDAN